MQDLLFSPISLDALKDEFLEAVKRELPAIIATLQQVPAPKATELLTRKEAATLLSVSLPTLNEWTKTGRVKGYRIASRVRYKRAELETSLSAINPGRRAA